MTHYVGIATSTAYIITKVFCFWAARLESCSGLKKTLGILNEECVKTMSLLYTQSLLRNDHVLELCFVVSKTAFTVTLLILTVKALPLIFPISSVSYYTSV